MSIDDQDPFFSYDSLDDEQRAKGAAGRIPEFVRKAAVAGLGAMFLTEEGIRGLASQLKLPKEALGFVIAQADKTKDDVSRVLTDELRRFFQSEKLREEFVKLLAGMTIEVKAEVRLVPDKKKKASDEPAAASEQKVVITGVDARRTSRKKKE